jgi:hypothetical protein
VRFGIVAEAPQTFAWLGPRRLAVVAGNSGDGSTLIMVDPVAGRILSRRRLAPTGISAAGAGGRAFVVTAGTGVAEVDLASLRVTYRRLRQPTSLLRRLAHWLVPPAEAKLNAGTWRAACWLGDGRLAVWGSESRVLGQAPDELRSEERPSGLKLIDTRSWTIRPLDPAATQARWQGGQLLAFGGTWDDAAERQVGIGLSVHRPGSDRPRHLLGNQVVMEAHLDGDLVYAAVDTGNEEWGRRVLSLRSGRVLSSSDKPLPWLLLGERGPTC